MKIWKRRISWIGLTLAFYSCLYLAFFENIMGAVNLAIIYTWYQFLVNGIMVVLVTQDENTRLSTRKAGWVFPPIVSILIDLIIILSMFWFGWFFTGIISFCQMFFEYTYHRIANELTPEEKAEVEANSRRVITDDLWDVK